MQTCIQAHMDHSEITYPRRACLEHVVDKDGIPRLKLVYKTQSLIVEAMDHRPDHPEAESGNPWKMNATEMPYHGSRYGARQLDQ